MEKISLNNALDIQSIHNELELERATQLFLELRLQEKENHSIQEVRIHLAQLIENYESVHWNMSSEVSNLQIDSSNKAEKIVSFERQFIARRKDRVKSALKANGLRQADLAQVLGHGKGYTSEIINGVRPLSKEDIVIIHRLLRIPFEILILPTIKEETADRITVLMDQLNKPKLKLRYQNLYSRL